MHGGEADLGAAPADRVGTRPLVAHVLYRFDTGGLENGLVNLVTTLPADRFRYAMVALDRVEPSFAARVQRPDVEFIELHKPPGPTVAQFPRLWRLFRRLRPPIVHTRNLAALDCQVPAWAAGVPVRIHGEHGRDVGDLDGSNRKNQWNRRLLRPFVQEWVALSRDLASTLTGPVGISPDRVRRICNGVDSDRFRPAAVREPIGGSPFNDPRLWVVGTVGRMQAVKNQVDLARAFAQALAAAPALRERLRLVMVGDGPLRAEAAAFLAQAGLAELAWLPGERRDVREVMRGLDCPRWSTPSLADGIPNVHPRGVVLGPARHRHRSGWHSRGHRVRPHRATWSRSATPRRWREFSCAGSRLAREDLEAMGARPGRSIADNLRDRERLRVDVRPARRDARRSADRDQRPEALHVRHHRHLRHPQRSGRVAQALCSNA